MNMLPKQKAEDIKWAVFRQKNKEERAIARKASGHNGTLWDGLKQVVIFRGLPARFSRNEDMKNQLLATGNAYLVECARSDRIWACGIRLNEEERHDISKWTDQNLLGFALMEVREALKNAQ